MPVNIIRKMRKLATQGSKLSIFLLCISGCTKGSLPPAEAHVLADLPGTELRNVTSNRDGDVICGELKNRTTEGEFKRFYSSWKTSHVVFIDGEVDFDSNRMVVACDLNSREKEMAADVAGTRAKAAEAKSNAAQRRWIEKNAESLDALQKATHQVEQDNADRATLNGR